MKDILENLAESDPFSTWFPLIAAVVIGIITTIRSYFGGPHCPSEATIVGKTVVITGGSSGIGLEVVKELLKRGGRMIIGSRNPEEAAKEISKATRKVNAVNTEKKIIIKELDLASLKSVKAFVKELGNQKKSGEYFFDLSLKFLEKDDEPKIDILINNAGVAFHEFNKTEEGFETHLVTNYLSHFLLTHLLLPKLKAAPDARIINVSAMAHYLGDLFLDDMNIETDYHYNKAFGQSKLALVMMARHMSNLLKGTNITINAMHPGIVKDTKQFKNLKAYNSLIMRVVFRPWLWLFLKSPEQGAQTIIYMAVASELKTTSGKYFSNCKAVDPAEKALNEVLAEDLYLKSLELTGLAESQI